MEGMIDGKTDNERCALSGTRLSAQAKGLVDLLVGKIRTCCKGRSAGGKGFTEMGCNEKLSDYGTRK